MLIIRTQQLHAMEARAVQAFEDRTHAHLQRYFPRHCLLLGEEPLRRVIQLGVKSASRHGLTVECCVRSYIEFMCRLGSSFDSDPLLPWATETLQEKTLTQIERGDALYDRAWDYIDHISRDYRDASGRPTTARFINELRSMRHGHDEVLTRAALPGFAHALRDRIEAMFPAKCRYVPAPALDDMVPRGIETAGRYAITTQRGIALVTVLLFVLGSGFPDDPLLPWASAALHDQQVAGPTERVDRLYAGGVAFLKRWWDSAPAGGA